jgi:hypothetical protein
MDMTTHSDNPAKSPTSESEHSTDFMRQLVAVPHSEIKALLDAEKAAKRKPKTSASRVSGAPSKKRS